MQMKEADRVKKLSDSMKNVQHSPIRKMFNMAGSKDNTVNLVLGEPDFSTPANIIDASHQAFLAGNTHYTHNSGILSLRKTIAEKLKREQDISYDPASEIIITAGAQEALFLTMKVLLDQGDEVILSNPYYSPYINEIVLGGGTPHFVNVYEENGFVFKYEDIKKAVNKNTKAILLNSPANPTGGVAGVKELEGIAEIALENDLYVISDDVYQHFLYDDADFICIASLPGMKERTIVIDSLSKSYAMTGWRVGYAACSKELYLNMMHLQENVMSCVNAGAQFAAIEAYMGDQKPLEAMIKKYAERRKLIIDGLNRIKGISCRYPKGAFYAFANIKGTGFKSEEFAMKLFEDQGVLLVPGSAFGNAGEGYIRISFAASEEILSEGLDRIDRFVNRN